MKNGIRHQRTFFIRPSRPPDRLLFYPNTYASGAYGTRRSQVCSNTHRDTRYVPRIEGRQSNWRATDSMRKFIRKEQWYRNHYCKEQSETYCENGLTFGWHIQNTSMSDFEIIISGKRNIRKCTNIYLTLGMYLQYVWGVCVWERGTRKGIVHLKPLKKAD